MISSWPAIPSYRYNFRLYPSFDPLFRNPHLLTLAGNFWPRKIDETLFPASQQSYSVTKSTSILVYEHRPAVPPSGEIVFLHGLEGSANAGYILSFAQQALLQGFGVHRANLRTCGGSEDTCETSYHAGLTNDTKMLLQSIQERGLGPAFLCGFSLGGNVALKLAGELRATDLLAGVIAISTPIDLAECVRTLDRPSNFLYSSRFLDRLKARIRRMSEILPEIYDGTGLDDVKSIWDFDDRFTAPLFGFGTAKNYYTTQSSIGYLGTIRVPTLVICAKDDPLVPFRVYDDPVFRTNPALTLLATEYGGHLGFLSKRKPRFWLDEIAMRWIKEQTLLSRLNGTKSQPLTSA